MGFAPGSDWFKSLIRRGGQAWTPTLQSPDCCKLSFTLTFLIAGECIHAPDASTSPALEPGWHSIPQVLSPHKARLEPGATHIKPPWGWLREHSPEAKCCNYLRYVSIVVIQKRSFLSLLAADRSVYPRSSVKSASSAFYIRWFKPAWHRAGL
jgi:hypothetical protein